MKKTTISLSAGFCGREPSSFGIWAVFLARITFAPTGSWIRPLAARVCWTMRVASMSTAGSRATLRGRRRTRKVWMDAPSRSQVESEKSSRMKAENEPREVGIAASVCWELEDRGSILICGMHWIRSVMVQVKVKVAQSGLW